MASEKELQHRTLSTVCLPYKTFNSPTSTDPVWQDGRNLYGTVKGYTVRRPGFGSTLEGTPTVFKNVQRIFTWKRWDGTSNPGFYVMVCDLDTVAKVYKFQIGVDSSFQLIFTSASAEPFDFVAANNQCFFGNGVEMKKYDGATVYKWGIDKPSAAPVAGTVAGGNQAFSGWYYRYTYINANTGHESSVSDLSACTGLVSSTFSPTVQVFHSTDPQVTGIKVYRTTDGGSTNPIQMQLVTTLANADATYTDATTDVNMANEFAPALYHNDPMPPCKGLKYTSNRIWGYLNNKVYYTCYEENAKGVFEESWDSALDGNYRNYASEVFALAKMPTGLAIYTAHSIYGVDGDSLDTFRWFTVQEKRGAKNRTCIAELGSSVTWIDTSKQVWNSDLGEVGADIRPDLSELLHASTSLTVHIAGDMHWIVVADAYNALIYVFNLDADNSLGIRQQWQTPWGVKATAIHSGDTSQDSTDLLIALNGQYICKLTPDVYTDRGVPYTAFGSSNLFDINIKQDPEWVGVVDYISVERNAVPLSDVLLMNDEDTAAPNYTSIFANEEDPKHRGNGAALIKKRYLGNNATMNTGTATAQRISIKFQWPTNSNQFALYSLDIASRPGASS